jgi:hypothetical protein
VSIVVVLVFLGLSQIEFITMNFDYSSINPFAIVLSVALAEQFSSHQIQKGIKTSRNMFFNTVLLSVILGLIVSMNWTENLILTYPYLVFLALIITYFIGKYQGIRLNEVLRFQSISKMHTQEKE